MGKFFGNLSYKFQRFMTGRYGYDAFSKFLLIVTLIGFVLSTVTNIRIFYTIAVVALIYSYFRMFSKNIYSRQGELRKYLLIKGKFLQKFNLYKKMWNERKTYKYFKCSKCKSVWRYPKGIGKIEITCKTCKNKMIRKT